MSEPREKAFLALYERHARNSTEIPDGRVGQLVAGVLDHVEDIDRLIESASKNWSIQRMAAVDASILRLAVFELTSRPETPTGVVINEAVELAKRYSTEQSGSFVNGVLAAIARSTRP
ncbi:MAG: transcription antitermination factor NusB [Acidimicrobiia bacterium]|nr:transcription antitermination factor NusB [Acidimicrobiia bacterium]